MLLRRQATHDQQAAYNFAILLEVERLQKRVFDLTEHLVAHATKASQQAAPAGATDEEVILIPLQVDIATLQLASLVRSAAATKDVKPLQEQVSNLTRKLAALAGPAPEQATPVVATTEEPKRLQKLVLALTHQLAALALQALPPSDVEFDDDNQYEAVNEHIPMEQENHTWKYQSKPTQPNNEAGISNFIKTVTTIFKKIDIDVPISIFKLPSSITSAKPEAYAPKLVGLGPLHHLRPELQHIQMYKVMEDKRIHDGFKSDLDLDQVIGYIKQLVGPSIRASYSIYLDMEDDELAGVMAIDGLFLLDFLCFYGIGNGKDVDSAKSSYFGHLLNSDGRRLPQNTIIQEAMMLENQIPIFVLILILITECSELAGRMMILRELFPKVLIGFCESFSPLKTAENYPPYRALQHAHVLDLLYHLVILKQSPERNPEEEKKELELLEELSNKVRPNEKKKDPESDLIEKNPMVSISAFGIFEKKPEIVDSAFKVIKIFAPLQAVPHIQLVQSLFDEIPQARSIISAGTEEEVPAKKTFLFPTASELDSIGVKFSNKADHITDIRFHQNTFYLPVITIKAHFEVIIRNLVAHEAMIKSDKEPPILNWYVQLMNWLIDSAKDVEVLTRKDDEMIISKPESVGEEQVAKIFGEMNKSVEMINYIPENLNNAIKSVKDHYIREKKALEDTFMKKCRRTVKKWFHIFAIFLALFLLLVQTVCSVYECPRFSFKTSNASPVQQVVPLPSLRSHLM